MAATLVGSKATILLVDDDEMVRTFLSYLLTSSGFRVLCASDAEQALAQSAAYGGEIHLLLSDIQMPPGMTGVELATRLHRERPEMKILLMSGVSPEIAQGWDFIRKPFRVDALKRDIRNLLADPLAESQFAVTAGAAMHG